MRKRIKDICEINKAVLSEQTSPDYCFFYIDISSVDSDGNINIGEPVYFGETPSRARRLVSYRDTIISTVRTYLKAIAFIGDNLSKDVIASTGFAVLTPHKELSPKFLYYAIRDDHVIDEITKRSLGVSYPAITSSELSAISVDIPSLSVQQRIVSYLDDKTAKIDKAVSLLQKKRDAYTRLKSSIINRAVTRGLNPNVKLKDSGVEWIGMIPENWDVMRLRDVCDFRNGYTPSKDDKTFWEDGNIPWFRMDDIREKGRKLRESKQHITEKAIKGEGLFKAGSFILATTATIGEHAELLVDCLTNQRFTNLNIVKSVNLTKEFFFYYLFLIDKFCKTSTRETTFQAVNMNSLRNCRVLIPPYTEQQAIASYLDTHCSRIDHAISIVDKQIDAYTRLKKSLINEVVTGKRKI